MTGCSKTNGVIETNIINIKCKNDIIFASIFILYYLEYNIKKINKNDENI